MSNTNSTNHESMTRLARLVVIWTERLEGKKSKWSKRRNTKLEPLGSVG